MPRTPKTPPTCISCPAPAVIRPGKPHRCERCAAIATDIANQKAAVIVQTLRALKAERKEEEIAA